TPMQEFQSYSGRLQMENESISVSFRVRIDPSGEVEFDFGTLPFTKETAFIWTRWQGDRSRFGLFSLFGTAEDGTELMTENLCFSSVKEHSNPESGAWISPVGRCSKAIIRRKASKPVDKPVLRMRLKGFRNFGPLIEKCPLGNIGMAEQTSIPDP